MIYVVLLDISRCNLSYSLLFLCLWPEIVVFQYLHFFVFLIFPQIPNSFTVINISSIDLFLHRKFFSCLAQVTLCETVSFSFWIYKADVFVFVEKFLMAKQTWFLCLTLIIFLSGYLLLNLFQAHTLQKTWLKKKSKWVWIANNFIPILNGKWELKMMNPRCYTYGVGVG